MYPELFKQIHPTLNQGIDIDALTIGMMKSIWWICDKCPLGHHIWQAIIRNRCANTKKAKTAEQLAGNARGRKTVANQCSWCSHHNGLCCPCDSFGQLRPDLLEQFMDAKNIGLDYNKDLDPFKIPVGSTTICYWKCAEHKTCDAHIWPSQVAKRTVDKGCPFCHKGSDKTCRCLSFGQNYPDLLIEFDLAKGYNTKFNKGLDPFNISIGSSQICSWKCKGHTTCDEHVWDTAVTWRTGGLNNVKPTGCPYCKGNPYGIVCPCDSFGTKYPNVLKEFVYSKNDLIDPYHTACTSAKVCWWQCTICQCQWATTVYNRTRRTSSGCPTCNKSKLEHACEQALIALGIQYIPQKTYPDCRDKDPLRYDYFLSDYNVLIETDGEQHFIDICFGGKTSDLEGIRRRDRIKNHYARDHLIHFLRISYSELANMEAHVRAMFDKVQSSPDRIEMFMGEEYVTYADHMF